MNIVEIKERFAQLSKNVKLAEAPFDIVRDPLTDFLYDKTVPSDLIKAKQKRALIEIMKMYRPDLDSGWEKNLTRLAQTTYRHQAISLFKKGDFKGIEYLTLSEWGKQLQVNTVEEIFEPKSLNVFTFHYWNDFEEIYQEEESLFKTFSRFGLTHKDEEFLKDAYFFIANLTRGKTGYANIVIPEQKTINPSAFIKGSHSSVVVKNENSPFVKGERPVFNH